MTEPERHNLARLVERYGMSRIVSTLSDIEYERNRYSSVPTAQTGYCILHEAQVALSKWEKARKAERDAFNEASQRHVEEYRKTQS